MRASRSRRPTGPRERAGAASSLSQTSNELGVALRIATLGSIATDVYRGQIAIPDGVPTQTATTVREGVAEGTAVARNVPGQFGDTLTTAVREAFTSGFAATALVSAAIVAVLATLAVVLFRQVRIGDEAPAGAPSDADAAPEDSVAAGEPS